MVTVVDAVNLLQDYSSHDFLRDRGEALGDEDDRTLVNLLVEQIEFADVVILNKIADAEPGQLNAARLIIRSLNADARIIETNHSNVPANAILNTGLFNFEKAHEHPMWAKELYGFADHVPPRKKTGRIGTDRSGGDAGSEAGFPSAPLALGRSSGTYRNVLCQRQSFQRLQLYTEMGSKKYGHQR